jgi:hypothetical protein
VGVGGCSGGGGGCCDCFSRACLIFGGMTGGGGGGGASSAETISASMGGGASSGKAYGVADSLITKARNVMCRTADNVSATALRRLWCLPLNARNSSLTWRPCRLRRFEGGAFVALSVVGPGLDGKGRRV